MSILHKKVPIDVFLSRVTGGNNEDPAKAVDALVLMFTYVDWAGTREAISAFLRCPLLRKKWQVAWDIALSKGYLQVGPRSGKPTHRPKVADLGRFWASRRNKQSHAARFRSNALFYLSDAGTKRAFELGRVRASYGWRSTSSEARGVADQVDILTKTKEQRRAEAQSKIRILISNGNIRIRGAR